MGDGATRREFLGTAAGVAAGLAGLSASDAFGQPPAVRVRRNIGSLDLSKPDDKKVLDQYTQGVRILQQRSAANPNDRRGWRVQAGLHTYRCQHGNWWFLPWHRAYLYYFERMIQGAIGDPAFALPYWDWTDSNQLTLPEPFRAQGTPLYDSRRLPWVNDGSVPLDWGWYDFNFGGILNYVLSRPSFLPSFGSPAAPSFPGLERTHGTEFAHGDLEGGPHDSVHGWVAGGGQADMGNPVFAALDPIFWLHHCNIDRLWSRWRAADPANHLNPTDPTWSGQQFLFLRPDGQSEGIRVAQVVNTWAAPLGYRYDDESGPPPAPPALVAVRARIEATPMATPAHAHFAAVAESRYELADKPLTLSLKLAPPAHQAVTRALAAAAPAAPEARSRVLLVVEGISFEDQASGVVEVYLNAPEVEQGKQPAKGHAVGTFSFFTGHATAPGAAPATAMAGHGGTAPRFSRVFDITETVRALQAANKWNPNELHVSLVRRPFNPERPVAGKVSFSRAELRVVPGS